MKITGTSSYVKVEIDGRIAKIQGELIVGGFVAYKNTIKNWEPPYESEQISDIMKHEIIRRVIDQTKNTNFVIEFE